MRTCSSLLLVLALLLASGGAGVPRPPVRAAPLAAPLNAGGLGAIAFAAGPAEAKPAVSTERFPEGTGVIQGFLEVENLALEDTLAGVWYRGPLPIAEQRYAVADLFAGSRPPIRGYVWFGLALEPSGGAPPGFYRLEVRLNGELAQAGSFVVEPASPGPRFANGAFAPAPEAPSKGPQSPGTGFAFPTGTTQVVAIFDYFGLAPGARWGWRLSREGAVLDQARDLAWDGEAEGSYALPLAIPAGDGLYDLDLFIGDDLAASYSFSVGEPAPAAESVLQSDEFDDPASGWGTREGDGARLAYAEGQYVIALDGGRAPAWATSGRTFTDGVVEVDASPGAEGARGQIHGVVVRYQNDRHFHAFLIDGEGSHAAIHLQDGEVVWDQPWTPAPLGLIRPAPGTNRLRVLARGPELRFYVNGRLLSRVAGALWERGQAGVLAAGGGEPVRVGFDHWRIWRLPGG